MQASPVLSLSPSSPSFNSYSSSRFAEIAARVVQEFQNQSDYSHDDDDIFHFDDHSAFPVLQQPQPQPQVQPLEEHGDGDEDEFEFAFVCREPDSSPVSADQIFYNGQIKPTYPLFNAKDDHLLLNHSQSADSSIKKKPSHRLPLRKLFSEEREQEGTSCSSSEADDLDGLSPGTYCVWAPKTAVGSPATGGCKKSNSTGSSKRWKFRDLLHRSNSDGKETFVFLAPSLKKSSDSINHCDDQKEKGKVKGVEEHYVRNRASKEGDKRKSFLPYRQGLVGFFSNVNGLGRN